MVPSLFLSSWYGPVTALLVMQASADSTLKMGAIRVGAVLAGVLVAILLSIWIWLTWWSRGLAIAASLVLGKVFRLGEQAMEAPISAMLILGVTSPDVAAEVRVLNTLIGAGVGIAFNLIYPPALPTRRAGRAIIDVAEATAAPLDAASEGLATGPINREQLQDWPALPHPDRPSFRGLSAGTTWRRAFVKPNETEDHLDDPDGSKDRGD